MCQCGFKPVPNIDINCFGCGSKNDSGLKMRFETDGLQLRSSVVVPAHMRGWNNIVHGGILSTICDEIMSWSAIYLTGKFILTKSLKVNFIKPVFIETRLTASGRIKKLTGERHALMEGEIRNPEDEIVTTCEGEFVLFDPETFKTMNIVPDELVSKMEQVLFSR